MGTGKLLMEQFTTSPDPMLHIEAKHLTNRYEKRYHEVQISKRRTSSVMSYVKCWIKSAQLDACILGCELPVDARILRVPVVLPCFDFCRNSCLVKRAKLTYGRKRRL